MENRRITRRRTNRASVAIVEDVLPPVVLGKSNSAVPPVSSAPALNTARNSPARSSVSSRTSTSRRASPARKRTSPVRRSSRPRSTVLGTSASSETITLASATVKPPSPIAEVKEVKPSPKRNNFATTLTTNTSSRAPHNKLQTTSSVHSSYSSTTQKTIEIRSSSSVNAGGDLSKLGDYLRRSLSKTIVDAATNIAQRRDSTNTPTTNTEIESRYSRSISRSIYGDDAEFSDNEYNGRGDAGIAEDDEEEEEHFKSFNVTSMSTAANQTTTCRKLEVPREFGGWLGATLLMLLAPVFIYYLQWTCAQPDSAACSWKQLNLAALTDVKNITVSIFQAHVVCYFLAFHFAVFILSAILPGKGVRLPAAIGGGALEYKFNAAPIAVLLIVAFISAELFNYPIAQFVLDNYLRFCVYSFINAFIVAIWCYIRADLLKQQLTKATQPNIYGKSGNFLIDFALGRHINPKWLDFVEFKQVFYRISLLSTLLLAVCFVWRILAIPSLVSAVTEIPAWNDRLLYLCTHIKLNDLALMSAAALLLYISDALLFEHHLASSFELQGEGFGCLLLLRYAGTPYLLAGVAKYIFETRPQHACHWVGISALLVTFAGLMFKRFASAIKYKYRLQPSHPRFQNVDSIHTFQGRRLLLSAPWNRVRQPNYSGDLLALVGLAFPLLSKFAWSPLVGLLLLAALLVHRTRRVEARNASRYHSSWVRYSSKVPYRLIPMIY